MKFKDVKVGMKVQLKRGPGYHGKIYSIDEDSFSIKWDSSNDITSNWREHNFNELDFKRGQFDDAMSQLISGDDNE